jgi:hypothetical protein
MAFIYKGLLSAVCTVYLHRGVRGFQLKVEKIRGGIIGGNSGLFCSYFTVRLGYFVLDMGCFVVYS